MLRHNGEEGKIFRSVVDERVFLAHWAVMHLAGLQCQFLALIQTGGHTAQHIHHLAIPLVAMQADGVTGAKLDRKSVV